MATHPGSRPELLDEALAHGGPIVVFDKVNLSFDEKVILRDVSVFEYPGTPDLMMVSFTQDYRSNNLSKRTSKRQFWAREGDRWRIVHEAVVGS